MQNATRLVSSLGYFRCSEIRVLLKTGGEDRVVTDCGFLRVFAEVIGIPLVTVNRNLDVF